MTPSEPGDETPKTVTEENPPENVLPFGAIGPESAPPQSSPPPASTDRKAKNGWRVGKRSETSAVNGAKSPGSPKGVRVQIDPERLVRASVMHAAGQRSISPGDIKLTQTQIDVIKRVSGLTPEQYREAVCKKMETVATMVLERLEREVDQLEPRDLPIAFGILNDHLNKTRGLGTPTVLNQTNIQINGVDRASALASLTGARKAMADAATAIEGRMVSEGNGFSSDTDLQQPAQPGNHNGLTNR